MGFRLQKRIKIFKGLTLNLSKTGTSWSIGGRGASINIRGKKTTGNIGIPGTGISYRRRLDGQSAPEAQYIPDTPDRRKGRSGRVIIWLLLLVVLGVFLAHQ
jgi:hypothetical protein